jgi:hypothetical protein
VPITILVGLSGRGSGHLSKLSRIRFLVDAANFLERNPYLDVRQNFEGLASITGTPIKFFLSRSPRNCWNFCHRIVFDSTFYYICALKRRCIKSRVDVLVCGDWMNPICAQKKRVFVYQVEIFDQVPSCQLVSRVLPLEKTNLISHVQ